MILHAVHEQEFIAQTSIRNSHVHLAVLQERLIISSARRNALINHKKKKRFTHFYCTKPHQEQGKPKNKNETSSPQNHEEIDIRLLSIDMLFVIPEK